MEKTRKTLEAKLDKLRADSRRDDVITFEQLGVDRLFVDESHFYKKLFLTTKMRNVAGLSTSEAQKSSDMFGKCRYLDEITGGRGVVFATGTPVSNSMTELYTVMRYLQYSTLQQKKLTHFDCWASTFGETTTAIELAPEGTGYRARTRFAKFFNLPELMSMFKEVADIKTSDQLHPRMTLQNRAKIFSPFAALRGYDEQLAAEKQRTERVTKRILTEEEMSALSDRLMQVTKGMTITVRYFKEDTAHPEVPAVGNYITLSGKADRIDPVFRTLQVGETVVPFEDLVELSGEGIMEIDQYLGISEE